jgi:hypothetical protein
MNPTFEKLDRFLVSPEWEEQYPLSIVTAMDRGLYNHASLWLDTGNKTPRNIPFRFENAWMQRGDFIQVVEKSRNEPVNMTGSIHVWQCKLRRLRKCMRGWNKNIEAWYRKLKKELSDKIDQIDLFAEVHGLTLQIFEERKELKEQLERLLKQEELIEMDSKG